MEKEIVQKNEIVTILNHMRLKHLGISLRDKDQKITLNCFISRVDANSVTVIFDKIPDIIPIKNLIMLFEYNKNYYSTSETALRILNLPLKSMELINVDKMFYHPMRKYTRVDVPESIEIMIKSVENPGQEQHAINIDELPATLRNIYMELKGTNPDIKKIITMIGEELTRFTTRYRINVFKDASSLLPLEKVVSFYKKTFWIEDTDNLNNYIHLRDKYNVIGYEKYFELAKKQLSPDILEEVRTNYLSRSIGSYAMVPIVVGEKVMGVIEVTVPNESGMKKLSVYEIFYIKGLADIMGEVLVKAKSGSSGEYSQFNIIDISLGGLLANTSNVYLAHNIKENSIVNLGLRFEEKEMEIRSKVVRYHYIPGEAGGLNIAFEFIIPDESVKVEIGNLIRKFLKISMEKSKTGTKETIGTKETKE